MKKHVITAVAFFMLLLAGCGEKQVDIVDSANDQMPPDAPAKVVQLLDSFSNPEVIYLDEVFAAPGDFDYFGINDSIYDAYLVKFLWGSLFNSDPPVNAAFSWDGTLSVNGPSIVRALTTIDFEDGEDSLVPDNHPWGEQWVSFTDNEFDGILFLVLYDKVTPTFAPQILTFDTEPIQLEFDFHQLIQLYAFYEVHPAYGVAISAQRVRLAHCREGYLNGHWNRGDSSEFTGTFQGLWFYAGGDTVGIYTGQFWKTNDAAQLLQGTVSGLYTDQVIAEFRGNWGFDDYRLCPLCGSGHGWFRGNFKFLNSDETGHFRGEFGDYSIPPNDRNMPMHGKWRLNCMNLNVDDNAGAE